MWSDRLGVVLISKRSSCLVDIRSILQRFVPMPVILKFLMKDIDDGLGRSRTALLRAAGWRNGLMGTSWSSAKENVKSCTWAGKPQADWLEGTSAERTSWSWRTRWTWGSKNIKKYGVLPLRQRRPATWLLQHGLRELIHFLCFSLVCCAWLGALQYNKVMGMLESSGGPPRWPVDSGVHDLWLKAEEAEFVHL